MKAATSFLERIYQEQKHDHYEVEEEPNQHRDHVVKEVDRTEAKGVKVAIKRLGLFQSQQFVDVGVQVDDVERGDLEDLIEERLGVGR